MFEEMNKKIKDADIVLVGIGEEFESSEKAKQGYEIICKMLDSKNYFIVSLCTDDIIFQTNLDSGRIVTPCGGQRKKQCPNVCTDNLYAIDQNVCPECGETLVYNNIHAKKYIESDYLPQWDKYMKWLAGSLNRKLVLLELGVSMKYPSVVRWPFERTLLINQKAFLYRINETLPQITPEMKDRAEAISSNSLVFLQDMNDVVYSDMM